MYMRVKYLFLTRKLRDLIMINAFIFFVQPMVLSASKNFENKLPIKPKIGEIAMTTWMAEDCLEKGLKKFKEKNANVVAFNDNYDCYVFALSKLDRIYLLVGFKRSSIIKDAKGWTTYVPHLCEPYDKRIVLWPLTKDSQGKNLGFGGKALDLQIPPGRCEFVSEAPQPWISGGKFCKLGTHRKDTSAMVHIVQNGHRLIDFSQEFTFELWIKSNNHVHQPLITSTPTSALRFMFWPSINIDQLVLAFSDKGEQFDYTTVDRTDRYKWRYLAVTYKPPNKVAFFRNAKKWPLLKQQMPWNPKIIPTTHIRMFFIHGTTLNTYGTLAMVGIHKIAIEEWKLKYMMTGDKYEWQS